MEPPCSEFILRALLEGWFLHFLLSIFHQGVTFIPMTDPFNLERFIAAQQNVYEQALREIQQGQKQSHWMWFVFPQYDGLGQSAMAKRYAIRSLDEAKAYLEHPVLGKRLIEITKAVLQHKSKTANQIFGYPDDLKLKSSMTLFHRVTGLVEAGNKHDSIFKQVLVAFFNGEEDAATLRLLSSEKS